MRRRPVLQRGIVAGILAAALFNGCHDPEPVVSGASFEESDAILAGCVAAYAEMSTLQVQGVFHDFRHGARRVVPVSWDLARPVRCRLQFDLDVAIVHGADCWTYRSATGRFHGQREERQSPIEKTSRLLSDGVPFLLPALWERNESALERDPLRGYVGWQLQGVAWSAERPCYVFLKQIASGDRENLLRIWIDQDAHLLRGWAIVRPTDEGREKIVMECMYHRIVINGRLPSSRFQLQPPAPIELPELPATTGAAAESP